MFPDVQRLHARERLLTSEVSDSQHRETEYEGQRSSFLSEIARAGSSKFDTRLEVHTIIKELTKEKTKRREEVTGVRKEAQSAHAATMSEKQKINSLELKTVSPLNVQNQVGSE